MPPSRIEIELNAAIVAAKDETPLVLVTEGPDRRVGALAEGLPFGPFDPLSHRTLDIGLRAWVQEQTGLELGYVEQLYTFGDRGRHAGPGDIGPHVMSIGYLALTRDPAQDDPARAARHWCSWYKYFPWEDMRGARPALLDELILPSLRAWAAAPPDQAVPRRALQRAERVRLLFGTEGMLWDEEKVLDRYECLYEAGLVAEAARDGREAALRRGTFAPLGASMHLDHRRILATAMGRLRAKLKYRPVIFELMTESFTLTELQRTVEAISGTHLHKQNFRRLVEAASLVEATGEVQAKTGGRPAALYRFRREVMRERPAPGLRVSGPRGR